MRPIARGRGWFAVAAGLTAAAALALIWALAEGESLANAIDDLSLFLLGCGVGSALWGWWQTMDGAAADRQRAEEERAKADAVGKRLETQRRWIAELRKQVATLEKERGLLGSTHDVPGLVLKTAKELVGAQKGLLLSRKDEDTDGDLDLLASDGFEHDPKHSGVA